VESLICLLCSALSGNMAPHRQVLCSLPTDDLPVCVCVCVVVGGGVLQVQKYQVVNTGLVQANCRSPA